MKINTVIDSNALALEVRNFGVLPSDLTKDWMISLLMMKENKAPHPSKAIIEIINSCNLDCPMCRVGKSGVNFNRVLSLNIFKEILTQIEGLKIVRLNGLGESTLVPNFNEYLDILFSRKLLIELISNGSGGVEIYKKILQNDGSIIISWDSAEKELFERLRRPAKWDDFVNNLKNITKDLTYEEVGNLSLLFTIQKENIGQLSKMVIKCKEWGIRNLIVNAVKLDQFKWNTQEQKFLENEYSLANKYAKEMGINIFLPSHVFGNKIESENTYQTHNEICMMPWKEVVVRWNGDVQVCNMFNPFVYGNINLNSFDDIWNNSFANLFRSKINTENRHTYCINCVYFEEGYRK